MRTFRKTPMVFLVVCFDQIISTWYSSISEIVKWQCFMSFKIKDITVWFWKSTFCSQSEPMTSEASLGCFPWRPVLAGVRLTFWLHRDLSSSHSSFWNRDFSLPALRVPDPLCSVGTTKTCRDVIQSSTIMGKRQCMHRQKPASSSRGLAGHQAKLQLRRSGVSEFIVQWLKIIQSMCIHILRVPILF